MRLTNDACWEHLRGAEHGILCTTNAKGTIDAVPVCFAITGKLIATPIDRVKPKDTTELGRLKNLESHSLATLICDHWKRDDWSQLWWVRAHLVRQSGHDVGDKARSNGEAALREKYVQYRDPDAEFDDLIVFQVKTLVGWSATEDIEPGAGDGDDVAAEAGLADSAEPRPLWTPPPATVEYDP